MKKIVTGLLGVAIVCLFAAGVFAQQAEVQSGKTIKQLVGKIRESKDLEERNKLLNELSKREPRNEQEVDDLIKIIKGNDEHLKVSAKNSLLNTTDKNLGPVFIKALDDKDFNAQETAIVVLTKMNDKNAVPKIRKKIKDLPKNPPQKVDVEFEKKAGIAALAAASLGAMKVDDEDTIKTLLSNPELMVLEGICPLAEIGAPALPYLVDAAKKDKDNRRGRKSAYAIGMIRDERAVPELIKLLKDEDEVICLSAVESLSAMKVKEAEPVFEELLNHKNEEVRYNVLRVLANTNQEKYLPKVLKLLSSGDTSMISIVRDLKEKKAVPHLEKLLTHNAGRTRYMEGTIRCSAAAALWEITGKAYKYEKDEDTIAQEKSYREMIQDEQVRYELGLKHIEGLKPGLSEKEYKDLIKDAKNRFQNAVEHIKSLARAQGYLLGE